MTEPDATALTATLKQLCARAVDRVRAEKVAVLSSVIRGRLITQLNELIKCADGTKRTKLHRLIKNLITKATTEGDVLDANGKVLKEDTGDLAAIQEIINRLEGKPSQKIVCPDNGPLQVEYRTIEEVHMFLLERGIDSLRMAVKNMYCTDCPLIVRKSLEAVPGVSKAVVSYKDKTAEVIYDDGRTDVSALHSRNHRRWISFRAEELKPCVTAPLSRPVWLAARSLRSAVQRRCSLSYSERSVSPLGWLKPIMCCFRV